MKITDSGGAVFQTALKQKVENYFLNKERTGNLKLFTKAAIIIVSATSLHLSPYLFSLTLGWFILLSIKRGCMMAFAGFNIGHDAIHGSFSKKKWVNKLMGYSFDLSGVSSWYWYYKHNIMHHTYTNTQDDDDLNTAQFLRLATWQKWYPIHRGQYIYAFGLYFMEHLYWAWYSDYKKYFTHKIGDYKIPKKMSVSDHFIFWGGKVTYISKSLVLPTIVFGWTGFWCFLITEAVCGFILSIVFQLAHVQKKSQFFMPNPETGTIEVEWAVEQVMTTADFATNNFFITSHLGGLNFQTIHHLFPKVSHVHYKELQNIVIETCNEFKINYNHYNTMSGALRDHFSYLLEIGKRPTIQAA
jgi:linoleoyl-CoA desaturase